jgi:hypothetical protein
VPADHTRAIKMAEHFDSPGLVSDSGGYLVYTSTSMQVADSVPDQRIDTPQQSYITLTTKARMTISNT